MKAYIIAAAIAALTLAGNGYADDETKTTTTETTATTGGGTVTTFTPGTSLIVKSETGPLTYKLGSSVTYVDSTGAVVQPSAIAAGSPVTVHYRKVGSDMVADRVVVTKKTTTTTTDD